MSTRRDFLKHLVVGAAGLLVADDVLEALVEPRRKYWVVGDISESTYPRWKPHRVASSTFDHRSVERWLRQVGRNAKPEPLKLVVSNRVAYAFRVVPR